MRPIPHWLRNRISVHASAFENFSYCESVCMYVYVSDKVETAFSPVILHGNALSALYFPSHE